MRNEDFENFSRSVMDEILSWDPSNATQLGWHKYDHEMMDPRREAFAHQAKRLGEFTRIAQGFDADALSEDQAIDRDLATYLFRLRHFELTRLRLHEQMSIAEQEIGRSLFFLFARDHLPLEARAAAMTSRLDKIPEFLNRTRGTIVRPRRLWNEIALETGTRLPSFLYIIRRTVAAKLEDERGIMELSGAVERAVEAIGSYEAWMREEVIPASEDFDSTTAEDFEEYLALKELGVTSEDALEIARNSLDAANRQRVALARNIAPSGTLADALRVMKSDHPQDFAGIMKSYRDWITKARKFVVEEDIVTVPDEEKLLVIETPHFMRHLVPFAAQYEPGKYTSDTTGLFLITPVDDNPDMLKEHCHAAVANTSVHEGYPGHHLQGIQANRNPSYIRSLSSAPCFAEGWALYCERMMSAHGFLDSDLGKLAQLNDLVFRVARVEADVRLSTKTMTPEEVADILIRETGMEKKAALDEARSYTLEMTNYLSYFIGMLVLLQLREDVETALGDRFDLKEFHDSLLTAGCLPVSYMRRVEVNRLMRDYGVELPARSEPLLDFARRFTSAEEPF